MSTVTSIVSPIYFVTYNLYKGGSLRLLMSLKTVLNMSHPSYSLHEYNARYPIRWLNFVWRIFLDQILISFLRYKCSRIIMFGNVPCIFFWGQQVVMIHNPNYFRNNWKLMSLRNFLEYIYFYFANKISIKLKKVTYIVQTASMKECVSKLLGAEDILVLGSPFVDEGGVSLSDVELNHISIKMHGVNNYFFYPAYRYESKNHQLLSSIARSIKIQFDIDVVCTTQDVDNVVNIGPISSEASRFILSKSAGLIFPSRHESLGYPLIEAAKIKKPIIAINKSYVNEVVSNAYLFEDDEDSLLQAFEMYARDLESNQIKLPLINIELNPSLFILKIIKYFETQV